MLRRSLPAHNDRVAHASPRPPPVLSPFPPAQSGKKAAPAAGAKKAAAPKAAAKGGKAAPAKAAAAAPGEDAIYASRPKSFRIGRDVLPKRELSRFVKWPVYVRLQRQKRILYQRLKTPPAVAQFRKPLDRAEALPVFKLLAKYKPETRTEKNARIKAAATAKAAGKEAAGGAPPPMLKFGLNHITYLIEQKKVRPTRQRQRGGEGREARLLVGGRATMRRAALCAVAARRTCWWLCKRARLVLEAM